MYENKTFENIMNDMLEEVEGEDIDKSEGSLVWNAVAKMAMQLEEAYEAISDVYDNIMVDTMDLEHLIAFGGEIGIPIKEATPAIFRVQTNCEFEEGDSFEHTEQDLSYTIVEIEDAENHIYVVECDDEGTEANKYLGEIEPEEYKEEFETGELIELVTPGVDEEEEEVYRDRIMNSWEERSFAGNRAYYVSEVGNLDGVGAVKAVRVTEPLATVKVCILNDEYDAPSAELIAEVQEAVDPEDSTGEGNGMAPIGAKVKILGATVQTINVTATLALASGVTLADIASQLTNAIDSYFNELATTWESKTGQVVRRARIESGIVAIEGVEDVSAITLNGSSGNIDIGEFVFPKKGTCTWNIQQ